MLTLVVLAATIWVCPGNKFSDVEKPGCKPFVEKHGTVNVEPTMPKSSEAMPLSPSGQSQPGKANPDSSMNAELCAMYKEYVEMEVRTQGGFKAGGPDELERWQTLRRMFQGSPPPRCS